MTFKKLVEEVALEMLTTRTTITTREVAEAVKRLRKTKSGSKYVAAVLSRMPQLQRVGKRTWMLSEEYKKSKKFQLARAVANMPVMPTTTASNEIWCWKRLMYIPSYVCIRERWTCKHYVAQGGECFAR